ncbi:hypothetical protein OEV98_00720 [Caldibacillus lycopersici]|uniref:Coupling factor for flagellin transcription and translation n=1 Tax=Perspicuibacillus lycopersici TaxID=1325689 RepID=A0AAE3IRD3_9BACI|nr:hypothetical protein [Perspicuibacillus lycopersici]MCU9612079.1 hypothetical protein [Perspicuibacillus lycopersici]
MLFLVIINILLTVIALLAIITLFMRQNRLMKMEKKYKRITKALEDSIEAFLFQMKEENEQFIANFQKMQHEPHDAMELNKEFKSLATSEAPELKDNEVKLKDLKDILDDHYPQEESSPYKGEQTESNMTLENPFPYEKALNHYQPEFEVAKNNATTLEYPAIEKNTQEITNPIVNDDNSFNKHDKDVNQIKNMLMDGLTIEEIAKAVNKGKTEIELLIRFTPALSTLAKNSMNQNH